jgi:hypothetical protein
MPALMFAVPKDVCMSSKNALMSSGARLGGQSEVPLSQKHLAADLLMGLDAQTLSHTCAAVLSPFYHHHNYQHNACSPSSLLWTYNNHSAPQQYQQHTTQSSP